MFVNPIDTIITFSSTIVSEFGDIDLQSSSQELLCFTCNINLLDSANSSCYGANDGFISVQGSGVNNQFAYSLQVFNSILNSWTEIANSPLTGTYTSLPVTFPNLHADSFSIIMTDSLSCNDTLAVLLSEPL